MARVVPFVVAVVIGAACARAEAPHVVRHDDGGTGALPPDGPPPDSAPGMDDQSTQELSLLAVVAKHFSRELGRVPDDDASPRERMRLFRWTHYWRAYEELLRPIRHKPGAVFVEVGAFAGGSPQVWSEWLGPEVDVHIVDLDDLSPMMRGVRATTWKADQANVSFWRDTFFPAVGQIDALIDDGGHTFEQQTVTLREALPWTKPGGVVIVEDTHTAYFDSQVCDSLPETSSVMHELRSAMRDNASSLSTTALSGSIEAYREPEGGLGGLQGAVDRLMRDDDGPPCRSWGGVLSPWSFIEEAKTLVTDLHAWWYDAEEPAPTVLGDDEMIRGVGTPVRSTRLSERLRDTRTLRGSLLGRRWRRWFVRHVASVRFFESIVVVQRWWHKSGRTEPVVTSSGSIEARLALALDDPALWGRLGALPVGDRTASPTSAQWGVAGAHLHRLVERVERAELRSRGRAK